MNWSLFPEDDARQKARVERVLLAALASAFAVALVIVIAAAGYLPMWDAQIFGVIVLVLVALGYGLVRSGLNLKFANPNLTVPFMLCAALSISFVAYHADQARGAVFVLYLLAFMFGVMNLRIRSLIGVAIFYWVCILVMIMIRRWLQPELADLRREAFGLVVMFMLYAWFTAMGWYIDNLRGKLRDASEKMATALTDMEKLARIDALTGCYNRRYAMEVLAIESKRVERGAPLSVCLLDVDHFKRINDSYGHQTGDEVLKAMAHAVQPLLRATDMLARYGGEEFLLLLSQTRAAEAMLVCERVRKVVADLQLPVLPDDCRISISIGTAEHKPAIPVAKTLQRADMALYEAKGRGRNCVVSAEMMPA